jgi:transposase
MSEKRKKYDREFREGAVRIVWETGKAIAQVARILGVHEGTLGNWVTQDREAREGRGELTCDDVEELKRLRDLSFSPIGGYGLSAQTAPVTLGGFDLANATSNPDGSYTIVLSPTEQPGNWIDTTGANNLWVRNTLGQWGAQPAQVSLTKIR